MSERPAWVRDPLDPRMLAGKARAWARDIRGVGVAAVPAVHVRAQLLEDLADAVLAAPEREPEHRNCGCCYVLHELREMVADVEGETVLDSIGVLLARSFAIRVDCASTAIGAARAERPEREGEHLPQENELRWLRHLEHCASCRVGPSQCGTGQELYARATIADTP